MDPELFFRYNETLEHFYARCNNLTIFDCSEDEMLWWAMGSRRLPLKEIIPISIVLVVIFLTGVVGNVCVCVVIVRNPGLHTATNYYLFSLAVSDLLLLLFGLPNDLAVYWHQYPYSLGLVFCKLRAFISEAATYVSVLTISAFSLERYLAICHPLHVYAMAGLTRASRIILTVWTVASTRINKKSKELLNGQIHGDTRQAKSRKAVIRMLDIASPSKTHSSVEQQIACNLETSVFRSVKVRLQPLVLTKLNQAATETKSTENFFISLLSSYKFNYGFQPVP
ncbi:unnamed protein product [Leptidea sinapis]|uniref:G-protein coupled receptors family 1 profile domain-containing protein n=1 Tax=Leptidea sinapis TaxID=189913 RepID=A0A5E4QYD9_9NEOP|nr:unnamed protein product [Leptidea sinapis]